jgi:hypothetical protein
MKQEGYTSLTGFMGYLLLKLPQDVLDEIKISVDKIQSNFLTAIPNNNALAGQIKKEYLTKLSNTTTQYIKFAAEQYHKSNPLYLQSIWGTTTTSPPLTYDGEAWINFQEKYEYNPIHHHSGVFSYVIWYQIPFYKQNEQEYGAGKYKDPNMVVNGEFQFTFSNGQHLSNYPLGIDKTMEGYMAIFPSSLDHSVHPFYTSDDYRISISGNLHLEN